MSPVIDITACLVGLSICGVVVVVGCGRRWVEGVVVVVGLLTARMLGYSWLARAAEPLRRLHQ